MLTLLKAVSYNYKEILGNMEITEFTKNELIEFAHSTQMYKVYISMFITLFIYTFIMCFITTLWYIAIISIFGCFTSWVVKIRMRYVAIFNMSAYAVTLSVILNMIYIIVNMFIPFTIEYFQVMYMAVATIYLIAAIFIIKSDMIKRQEELMKIAEAEAIIRKESNEKPKDEEKEENKETDKKPEEKKKDKEQEGKKKQDGNLGNEPEGSNA